MTTRRKILWWVVAPAVLTFVVLTLITAILLRPASLKRRAETTLSERLKLDVTIDELSFSFFPRPNVSGHGVTLRVPNRPDLPPFITLDHFSVNVGLLSALRGHVRTVHAGGLRISVPPSDVRQAMMADARSPEAPTGAPDLGAMSDVIIEEFVTHDAELVFVPRKPGKRPLTFRIHDLTVREIGFDRRMPYDARLTNPVPQGVVKASGTIGPWLADAPTETPLDGTYTFTDADLGTINGIGGTLQSEGTFSGRLTAITAKGTSVVPDFSLDLGGKPVRLTATFDTTVDGTDGTTVLNRVDARILDTPMVVTGAITNLDGPGRHDVDLHVEIANGRIEDLMVLVIDAPESPMTGDVQVKTSFKLPPGPERVRDRLTLSGEFGLGQAKFTDADVQAKMQELSRRSQGKSKDDPLGRVMTSLSGKFTIDNGRLTLPDLAFDVPGASVKLRGTYGLATSAMNFRGTLRMKATVSKAVGGFKSIFLKPFDPLFRKKGAGAVLPIKITGTRDAPKFGLEVGKVFK